ncbi:sensor histidine kinase [Rhizobium sp. FY34]|uniref:sensor histidine kinase n=1 Tax=Rhizobium sp. FY34 TaxID=2562309 RepID=UPI0032B2B149
MIGFEVKHDFPTIGQRTFLVDARHLSHLDGNSSSILVLFDDVTERQRNDAEMGFIIAEMRHRMKNLFAVVRAIALQTDTKDRSAIEYRDSFLGRLNVTLRTQEMTADCKTANFEAIIRQSVGAIGLDRIECGRPAVELVSARILSTSMIFHELTTNAIKCSALSVPEGRVSVKWRLEDGQAGRSFIVCAWREEAGPAVAAPQRMGYGTQLINGPAAHLGGRVELIYGLTGLEASIRIPL